MESLRTASLKKVSESLSISDHLELCEQSLEKTFCGKILQSDTKYVAFSKSKSSPPLLVFGKDDEDCICQILNRKEWRYYLLSKFQKIADNTYLFLHKKSGECMLHPIIRGCTGDHFVDPELDFSYIKRWYDELEAVTQYEGSAEDEVNDKLMYEREEALNDQAKILSDKYPGKEEANFEFLYNVWSEIFICERNINMVEIK
jgi:hypothetical protein